MQIQILIKPNEALEAQVRSLVDQAIAETGIEPPEILVSYVQNEDDAKRLRCIASPTIRIDGYDCEYAEREPPETSAEQRYYSAPEGWLKTPTVGMIAFAIREGLARAGKR